MEAISINYGNILYDTPYLTLHDWHWVPPPLCQASCIQSLCQIQYPAGLAPWTTSQYQELDKTPAELLRQIYGLRRTFPSDIISAPEDLGGCGETRISDAAQLQKWTHLHSLTHNGGTSTGAVTSMLKRALASYITDPPVYCSSLVD